MGSSELSDLHISFESAESFKKKKSIKKWLWIPGVIAFAFFATLGVRLYNQQRFHFEKQTRFMMDSFVTVYAVGPKSITGPAVNLALDRMQDIYVKFNSRNPDSAIFSFNEKGIPISDPEIIDLVRIALKVSEESGGAFDITVAPLIELWGFYNNDTPRLPSDQEIKGCLENIGYHHLALSETMLGKKKPGVKIELGGIAQGYAVSQAVSVLKQNGVSSALVDVSGDIYALGKKGDSPWKVGIRHPRQEGLLGFIEVENLAVLGSGDYERFFMKEGKRYHHIFNPKTGYPAEGISGMTLVYSDPTAADAWDTAIFVLGTDKGMPLLEKYPGMEVLMIKNSGEILYSKGMKNALTMPGDK